jgi:hypothetical protein
MAQPGGSQKKETSRSVPVTDPTSHNSEINQRDQQFSDMHLADLQKVFEKEADENGGTAMPKAGFCDSCLGTREAWRAQTWCIFTSGVLFKTYVWVSGARILKAIWGSFFLFLRSC